MWSKNIFSKDVYKNTNLPSKSIELLLNFTFKILILNITNILGSSLKKGMKQTLKKNVIVKFEVFPSLFKVNSFLLGFYNYININFCAIQFYFTILFTLHNTL